jgi:hypothetical protein
MLIQKISNPESTSGAFKKSTLELRGVSRKVVSTPARNMVNPIMITTRTIRSIEEGRDRFPCEKKRIYFASVELKEAHFPARIEVSLLEQVKQSHYEVVPSEENY